MKYSSSVNHLTALDLAKLDALDTLPKIKVTMAYRDLLTGQSIASLPADPRILQRTEAMYLEFDGWQKSISKAASCEPDLPGSVVKPDAEASKDYDLPKQTRVVCPRKSLRYSPACSMSMSNSNNCTWPLWTQGLYDPWLANGLFFCHTLPKTMTTNLD